MHWSIFKSNWTNPKIIIYFDCYAHFYHWNQNKEIEWVILLSSTIHKTGKFAPLSFQISSTANIQSMSVSADARAGKFRQRTIIMSIPRNSKTQSSEISHQANTSSRAHSFDWEELHWSCTPSRNKARRHVIMIVANNALLQHPCELRNTHPAAFAWKLRPLCAATMLPSEQACEEREPVKGLYFVYMGGGATL